MTTDNDETQIIALQTVDLTMQFGGLKAVSHLSLQVPRGSIFGLIGPNGAGKTTIFNVLTGVYQPTHGSVTAFGKSLANLKPWEITARGVARTFQNIRLFKDLTVCENLMIALDHDPARSHFGIFPSVFRTRAMVAGEMAARERAAELLELFGLRNRKDEFARNLPYGDQRRLEIARAMATGAKILLLDEPAAGMNAHETASLMATIRMIRDKLGITVFLIEHDMRLVMGICERIAVLDYGEKIAEGTAAEIQRNPKVVEAYLGKAASHE